MNVARCSHRIARIAPLARLCCSHRSARSPVLLASLRSLACVIKPIKTNTFLLDSIVLLFYWLLW
jgi:hypothetical protein